MRRLGTLAATNAERFAASIRSRGIATVLRPEADGSVGVWIQNEDQLDAARGEFEQFEAEPTAARFDPPPPDAAMETVPAAAVQAVPPNRPPAWKRVPVTCTLIGICVVVDLVVWFGGDFGNRLQGQLSIAPVEYQGDMGAWIPANGLGAIQHGQVWRLVTPIFLHADPVHGPRANLFHLLFNMAWLWLLGGAVETVRGSWRLGILVLISAAASNLAEYYFNFGFDIKGGWKSDVAYAPNPFFLGMSGVVFALFGFIWIRSRLVPRSGFLMPRDMVVWMLIWLLVCTSGLAGPIANVAHGVGLLVGMVLGGVPRLWKRA